MALVDSSGPMKWSSMAPRNPSKASRKKLRSVPGNRSQTKSYAPCGCAECKTRPADFLKVKFAYQRSLRSSGVEKELGEAASPPNAKR